MALMPLFGFIVIQHGGDQLVARHSVDYPSYQMGNSNIANPGAPDQILAFLALDHDAEVNMHRLVLAMPTLYMSVRQT
jgi:hypothetical protein